MGSQCNGTMILYASQAEPVWQEIRKNGVAFSKREYVRRKYGESAPVFLTAYNWFVRKLPQYVQKPEGAEFPYWAFADQYTLPGGSTSSHLLTLEVPVEEAVYFDMYDWNTPTNALIALSSKITAKSCQNTLSPKSEAKAE